MVVHHIKWNDGMNRVTFLKMPQVKAQVALCKAQIYKLMNQGLFPQSYKLTPKSVAWRSDEIEQWMESRMQSSAKGVK